MPSQELAVMLDFGRRAVGLPILLNRAHAVWADRDYFPGFGLSQGFKVRFGQLLEQQIVAETPYWVAGAPFLAQNAKANFEVTHDPDQSQKNIATARVVCAHASQPEAIFLRAVKEGQGILVDKFFAL